MSSKDKPKRRWARLERWLPGRARHPRSKKELRDILRCGREHHLLDSDALSMMEGVLQVADLQVRDIMIPRAEMTVVGRDDSLDDVLQVTIDSAHSRFPVIGDDRSEVVGILLAKDLLQYCGNGMADRFNVRDLLRSAVFVPESKRLNVLLKEFKDSRNHIAIVVDEYGGAAGLLTIEDVLEQIVGEIEDEHDFDEGAFIFKRKANEFTAKAHTDIDEFNEYFGTDLPDDEFDTIGGLVVHAIGHMPERGESVRIDDFTFTVLRADSRKVRLLNVWRHHADEAAAGEDSSD